MSTEDREDCLTEWMGMMCVKESELGCSGRNAAPGDNAAAL